MELTVIGSEPAWPAAGRACSGYLLEQDGYRILIDCGTGVFERLRAHAAPEDLDAVILTHLHFDHWIDLVPFRYYLRFEAQRPGPRLLLPPRGVETALEVTSPIDAAPDFLTGSFGVEEYDPSSELTLGPVSIRFARTTHPIETYALRVSSSNSTLVFTADTAWDEGVVELARGCGLLLAEAAFAAGPVPAPIHMNAAEAGRMAAKANAQCVVLTHLSAGSSRESVALARSEFAGPVEYAEPGNRFTV